MTCPDCITYIIISTNTYRDHLIICKCKRCEDPTELGSYMSALRCQKCDSTEECDLQQIQISQDVVSGNSEMHKISRCILPQNPLDFNSSWSCAVHRQIEVQIIIFMYLLLFFEALYIVLIQSTYLLIFFIRSILQICGKNAQQIQLDLQIDLYKDGLVTTIPRLHSKILQRS